MHVVPMIRYSKMFSSNSEAFISELLKVATASHEQMTVFRLSQQLPVSKW